LVALHKKKFHNRKILEKIMKNKNRFFSTGIVFTLISVFLFITTVTYAQVTTSQEQQKSRKTDPGYRIIGAGITGASQLQPNAGTESKLMLESSDARLVKAFDWAKRQARAYAREGDPVGAWYEGGEPGRESFCMRDISHQVMGGHALGLARNNLNMLHRFAENIAESRDWCSYWGMTRMNKPRRVDYRDDTKFWYCLPANFDVVSACYRMFLWSGDSTYVTDPVFLNFYDRSVVDYVERWALDIDHIMKRPRLLNVRGVFDPQDKFQKYRGIPGYDEQTQGYIANAELLSTQYAAYLAYAYIQEFRGDEEKAQKFQKKAAEIKNLMNTCWWNEQEKNFYARVDKDYKMEGRGGGNFLFHNLVDDGQKIKDVINAGGRNSTEVLYRYGDSDSAYSRMMDIAFGPGSRREYPEVSFSWIGSLVNGTMGITVEAPSPYQAWVRGYWVDKIVRTLSGLGTKIGWAELRNLPIRANEITVRHEGIRKTTLINQHGPSFIWRAVFPGSYETLLVNGRPMKALIEKDLLDRSVSSVRVTLGAGGAVSVEIPK